MAHLVLPVPWYQQQMLQWCWAACIEMVVTYFNTAAVQQCQIANQVLGRNDCCVPPAGWCNTPVAGAVFCPAYAMFGVNQCNYAPAAITFAQVQQALNTGSVLEIDWQWNAGGGHTVLLVGWDDTGPGWVQVNDPWSGQSWMSYPASLNAGGQGFWVETWALHS